MDGPQSTSELLVAFQQFLIVLTHELTYLRGIYPSEAFGQRRVYETVVHQCRHPKVVEWIENLSVVCMEQIRRGTVHKVSIVILREHDKRPLERFALDIRDFPKVASSELDQPLPSDAHVTWGQIIDQYRSCLRALALESGKYGPIKEDDDNPLTFTVLLELSDNQTMDVQTSPWIVADAARYHEHEEHPRIRSIPIRFVDAGPASFHLVLEEERSRAKQRANPSPP
ncbi:hypothetical protein TRICI_005027 [Trichomonascus ciferrii]|uniref:HORMA domain-containing protein n=1 Tax=Trichomonascus ciferrii TaxID=44093 RepID=A0A642UX42_9ASCO|nr:hypothetical protein TRICI_005027 [Trichomonascus ciferrii]